MLKSKVSVILLIGVLIYLDIDYANAQNFFRTRRERDVIASLGAGITSYYGEINDPGDVIDTKLNANLGLQYFFSNRVAGRMEFTWFQLSGDDADADAEGRVMRNLSFSSNNYELSAVAIVNAFPIGNRFYQRPQFNIYGFAGLGVLFFNPRGEVPATDWNGDPLPNAGDKVALQPLQTEGEDYSRTTIVVPYGVGIKYLVNPFFNIAFEGGYRQTFTDYLDDVSTEYLDNTTLTFEDPLAAAMADRRHELGLDPLPEGNKRGNPDSNDGYFIFNIKLEFYLPPDVMYFGSQKRRRGPRKNLQRSKRR